jgi:hypothetical protein
MAKREPSALDSRDLMIHVVMRHRCLVHSYRDDVSPANTSANTEKPLSGILRGAVVQKTRQVHSTRSFRHHRLANAHSMLRLIAAS